MGARPRRRLTWSKEGASPGSARLEFVLGRLERSLQTSLIFVVELFVDDSEVDLGTIGKVRWLIQDAGR